MVTCRSLFFLSVMGELGIELGFVSLGGICLQLLRNIVDLISLYFTENFFDSTMSNHVNLYALVPIIESSGECIQMLEFEPPCFRELVHSRLSSIKENRKTGHEGPQRHLHGTYLVARIIFFRAVCSFCSICCLARCSPTALAGNSVSHVQPKSRAKCKASPVGRKHRSLSYTQPTL